MNNRVVRGGTVKELDNQKQHKPSPLADLHPIVPESKTVEAIRERAMENSKFPGMLEKKKIKSQKIRFSLD